MNSCLKLLVLASIVACVVPGSPVLAQITNDNCATPTTISGTGTFAFNLVGATTGPEGQNGPNCFVQGTSGITNDVWYCWTATCSGLAYVSTCGLTTVDTKIAFYTGGCACPTNNFPLCCNDDGGPPCSLQASISCEVTCGQQYLIQLGTKPGAPPGSGSFSIQCSGTPCECDSCCGGRPNFLTTAGFTSGVAIQTQEFGPGAGDVVVMFDMNSEPPAGNGNNWGTAALYAPSGPQNWTKTWLGSVFGVALDGPGNVYLAHTPVYSSFGDAIGTIPGGAAGAIYKIDTNTGIPSTFTVLPNNFITGCTGTECWPGLGDLAYSCKHGLLYASNFEDGRIYAINSVGTTLYTWKHATGVSGLGGGPDPFDTNGFAPLGPHPTTTRGQRVWAVGVNQDRLYYSTWREDGGRASAAFANEIWSVALVSFGPTIGQPIAGSEQLEITMPVYANTYSNPVAGISFKPLSCCILLAERTMFSDTGSNAHNSRLLEYCKVNNTWVPSGNNFTTGDPNYFVPLPDSCAGGCDYDFASGAGVTVNVWSTSDAIKLSSIPLPFEAIYGMAGMPYSGGNAKVNGVMLDSDTVTSVGAKMQQGDMQVSCPQTVLPPCQADASGLFCINGCIDSGLECHPLEITLGLDGQYRITKCGCDDSHTCHVEMGPAGPICVNNCPQPGVQCSLLARGNVDGSITFKCDCVNPDLGQCNLISECDPDHPGTCVPACQGVCPQGYACIPTELREFPAGSGNFSITECTCLPIINTPCHPVMINGLVRCIGVCPTGGPCKVIATQEFPAPGGVRYRCRCSCTQPPSGMRAWYPLDENPMLLAHDIAGVAQNGTPLGGPTPVAGCVGGALLFDGVNDYVDVANHAHLNFGQGPFSIDAWIKTTAGNGIQSIVDKRVANGGSAIGYSIFLFNGQMSFQIADPSGHSNFIVGPNIADGQCHHVAVSVATRNVAGGGTIFVDGVAFPFNPNRPGSVSNTANLWIGRHSLGGGFFPGVIDEVEIFARALTLTEVQALYNAGNLGKCREAGYVPSFAYCINEATRASHVSICNYNAVGYMFSWYLSGPNGGVGCSAVGPMTFTPSSGSVYVPAGQCVNIPVVFTRPAGLSPGMTACYQMTVTNTTTGNSFVADGKLTAVNLWCIIIKNPKDVGIATLRVVGPARTATIEVSNNGDPTNALHLRIRAIGPDMEPDLRVISLNGLPPGEPWFGQIVQPQGVPPQPVSFTIAGLEDDPLGVYTILLEADLDGDSVYEQPLGEIAMRTVTPCGTDIPGDIDEDGDRDAADIGAFVQALLGSPADPYQVILSDVDCDGQTNGKDVRAFTAAMLTPL